MEKRDWYRIANLAGGGADVFIYDEIGSEGIEATDFVQELGNVKGPINLRLNSPGGEVYDGLAIYNALKDRENVTVYVDSLAASIASVIAMAGHRVIMAKHSTIMIHDAFGGLAGNAADMLKMSERLEATSQEIASVYQERAGGDVDEWRNRMKEETWYNAEQAVAAGLADEVAVPKGKVKNLAGEPRIFNLSKFRHVPEWVQTQSIENAGKVLSKKNLEQLHTGMDAMAKVHEAACDSADCAYNMSAKARTHVTIKNEGMEPRDGMTTITAYLGAQLHETLSDIIQDWLADGSINMDEFLPMSALVTALITSLDQGLDKIGISDREVTCDDDEGGAGYTHTVTETYDKDGNKIVAKVEKTVEEPVVVDDPKEEPVIEAGTKQHLLAADFIKLFDQAIEDAAKSGGDCPTCDGTGKINKGTKDCPDCGGTGKAEE